MKEMPLTLVEKTKEWLGEDGLEFFKKVQKDHGKVSTACWMEGKSQQPVHFREVM